VAGPVLYDACSLQNFGAIGRLDLLRRRHGHIDPPRWTETVADEVAAGAGTAACDVILADSWLGVPIQPSSADQKRIFELQIGLNEGVRPATKHLGEAESLHFADRLGGTLVTDDNGAYDFAFRMLGVGRVRDTVDVLRESVAQGELLASEAHLVANAMRNSGRSLRRIHPPTLPTTYFD